MILFARETRSSRAVCLRGSQKENSYGNQQCFGLGLRRLSDTFSDEKGQRALLPVLGSHHRRRSQDASLAPGGDEMAMLCAVESTQTRLGATGVEVATRTIACNLNHHTFAFDSAWSSIDEVRFDLPYSIYQNGQYVTRYMFIDNLVVGSGSRQPAAIAESEDQAAGETVTIPQPHRRRRGRPRKGRLAARSQECARPSRGISEARNTRALPAGGAGENAAHSAGEKHHAHGFA